MSPTDNIPRALTAIAEILVSQRLHKHAGDIMALHGWAISDDDIEREKFRREVTTNKWYWLGMGTIADVAFTSSETNQRFIQAYYDLATACEEAGCASIHSRDAAKVFDIILKK